MSTMLQPAQWLPVERVQEELQLSRYLMKKLREKHNLKAKRTIDGRMRLIDLTAAKRCLEKEMTVQAE